MSADRPTHDVSYELGGIKQALDTITRTLSENRTADAQYRTGIRAEMKVQSDAINAVGSDMALAKRDISDMKPKVENLDERAKMTRGATNLAIALGKFAHIISAAIGGVIVVLVERFFFGGSK
jgi:transcriptional accessory protein Tex/SPT6